MNKIFIPNPQKFTIKYQKTSGEIGWYDITPVDVNETSINAYCYATHGNKGGVRTFLRGNILDIVQF